MPSPAVRALAARPGLWPTAVRELWRLAPPGWWHRWPPLPRPDPAYLRFRMQTAYGDAAATPSGPELIEYLAWCRRMGALSRRSFMSPIERRHRASVAPVPPDPPAADRSASRQDSDTRRRFRQR